MSVPLLVIGNKNYSSWSLRAWLVLRKCGVHFDERRLLLDTPDFAEEIGDLSPSRCVPVLWHGARCIWDSYAIAEYANERFADGALWPSDPDNRGWARSISAEMHAGFGALRGAMPMNLRAAGRVAKVDNRVQGDINRSFSLLGECRAGNASGGPWLFGDFSIADAMYAPLLLRFPTYGVDLPAALRGYLDHWLQDRDLRDWLDAAAQETEIVAADETGLP
jgi:glutathione S-transferase